ncbi:MAG: response regulator [Proteobacteria bacterium]|nr:response regulator [Pseudomonadota bacterium]
MSAPAPVHVFLVEDHAALRGILERSLRLLGHEVTTFASGREALEALTAGAAPDLVLSDIRMPGSPDGLELAHWLRAHRPRTRVLLQSGYSDVPTGGYPVLRKPFTPAELADALDALLAPAG